MLKNNKLVIPECRIETTNRCNANCTICAREDMTRPYAQMCWGHFVSLVEQFKRLGGRAVSLFGFGEPLMDRTLIEKLQYVTDQGLVSYITTNGQMLTLNRSRKVLDAGLKNIRFSIHAIAPVRYKRIHRGLDWLLVWRNFANFIQLNDKLGHPCTVHMSTIPMHGERVKDIREVWEPYVDFLEIWKPHNWGGVKTYRKPDPKKATCGRPFNGPLQIQADGKVIPCCFLTNGEVILGDTFEKTIRDILFDEPYETLKEAHRTGNLEGYPCETCDQRNDNAGVLLYSSRDKELTVGVTSSCKLPVS